MIVYHGWIEGKVKDIPELRKLGVTGEMICAKEINHIDHCIATEEVIERIIKKWPDFWPAAFTAVDEQGKPLSKKHQKYWGYVNNG